MNISRVTRAAEHAAMLREHAAFVLDGPATTAHRDGWPTLFRERIGSDFAGRVILDVGCADGEYLARIAAQHSGVAFVGLDWKYGSIHAAATRVAEAKLQNVVLIRGRAQDLPLMFGHGAVDEIWVFQPEPCDRPAERANRLMNEAFLLSAHGVMRGGGSSLHLKTDDGAYFEWVRSQHERSALLTESFAVTATSDNFWNDVDARSHTAGRAFAGERTLYEMRFLRRRRPIRYLEFTRR